MDERDYYLSFSYFHGVGPKKFQLLLKHFGSAKNAWNGSELDLKEVLGPITLQHFIDFRKIFSLENELLKLEKAHITYIASIDSTYPKLLKNDNYTNPFILFVKGNSAILNDLPSIAVVGTRKITQYGREVTETLTSELVERNFVIVSGLAFGVDASAHTTTIKMKGKTIAVLGCGVDCCTPITNQKIYDNILDSGGTIVSEFRPGEEAHIGSFPARNEIIAGLSLGVLVTEGAADSGALITAEYAKLWNRPIFAIPGQITSGLSKGPNDLLKKGAVPVTGIDDILNNLGFSSNHSKSSQITKTNNKDTLSKEEKEIFSLLESGPLHFDEIVRKIGKDSKHLGSLLSLMELKGAVKISGGTYSI